MGQVVVGSCGARASQLTCLAHSMGGLISLMAAAGERGMFQRLVVCSPMLKMKVSCHNRAFPHHLLRGVCFFNTYLRSFVLPSFFLPPFFLLASAGFFLVLVVSRGLISTVSAEHCSLLVCRPFHWRLVCFFSIFVQTSAESSPG